jgi:hypothetical protein
MEEFKVIKNKELLWKLLCDNKNFIGMVKKDMKGSQRLFEEKIVETLQSSQQSNVNLLTLNKEFLKTMNSYCNNMTINKTSVVKISANNELITKEDIQKSELNSFDTRLNKRQQEFEQYSTNKPEEISFIDDNEDTPLKDIDNILKSKIAERNYEVQNIDFNNSKEDTEKWLGVNPNDTTIVSDINDDNTNTDSTNIQNIQNIHNNTENIEMNIEETPTDSMNIFTKLKTDIPMNEKSNNKDIENKLDLIIENQNMIIELLKNKK